MQNLSKVVPEVLRYFLQNILIFSILGSQALFLIRKICITSNLNLRLLMTSCHLSVSTLQIPSHLVLIITLVHGNYHLHFISKETDTEY